MIRQQLQEFCAAMGIPTAQVPGVARDDEVKKSARLLVEELCEAMEELFPSDYGYWRGVKYEMTNWINEGKLDVQLVGYVKELADIKYVTEAAFQTIGVNSLPVEAAVHASNMSKLVDGKPLKRDDGKVLKGPNYAPPDIATVLLEQGWAF